MLRPPPRAVSPDPLQLLARRHHDLNNLDHLFRHLTAEFAGLRLASYRGLGPVGILTANMQKLPATAVAAGRAAGGNSGF
jgi:hypothetical protein